MKTSIIPDKQAFYNIPGSSDPDLKAICIFAATGFFLGNDTYFCDKKVLQPATEYETDENNFIISSNEYWQWHYAPRDISLQQATEEFAHLFEKISTEKLKNKKIILPLSGGLDSRTQAAALKGDSNVNAYSYKFADSFDETKYGKKISEVKSFNFREYVIPKGYLWKVIDRLSEINKCYADFTNPRQMAVIDEVAKLGDAFYLGHWGDVLFDGSGVEDNISFEEQVKVIQKKIIKRGGAEFAESLWKQWGIDGSFEKYLSDRISVLLQKIKIENANSRIRAFKSLYWAPRWTSVNMEVFSKYREVVLPYYDDEMCKFICTIPENLLSSRKTQIEYIKMKNPQLAEISWQNYDPLNLYNYTDFNNKSRIPSRAYKKLKRLAGEKILGKKITTRNWEIQFTGEENDKNLRMHLFDNKKLTDFISEELITEYYKKFREKDSLHYAHPVNMLLTISMFCKKYL